MTLTRDLSRLRARACASARQAEIPSKPWRRRMMWPTRTQQIGLMMLLAVLVLIALTRALTV